MSVFRPKADIGRPGGLREACAQAGYRKRPRLGYGHRTWKSRPVRLRPVTGRMSMRYPSPLGTIALLALLGMAVTTARAFDESQYPNLKGQWRRVGDRGLLAGGAGGLRWDDSKPPALTPSLGQEPPLTPEYQAIYEANLADMAHARHAIDPTYALVSPSMPRVLL